MSSLWLEFDAFGESPELSATSFHAASFGAEVFETIRGRTSGPDRTKGTFPWTSGVIGATVALLKAAIAVRMNIKDGDWLEYAGLSSSDSELAKSLDYSLSKQPRWLLDMFGVDSHGVSLARRMFIRINPEQKRPGPVRIVLNKSFLNPANIYITRDGVQVHEVLALQEIVREVGGPVVSHKKPSPRAELEKSVPAEKAQADLSQQGAVTQAILDIDKMLSKDSGKRKLPIALKARSIEGELPHKLAYFVAKFLRSNLGSNARLIAGNQEVIIALPGEVLRVASFAESTHGGRIVLQISSAKNASVFVGECPIRARYLFMELQTMMCRTKRL